MGFCTPSSTSASCASADLRAYVVDDGIHLRKYWFSVSDDVQSSGFGSVCKTRFRQWKLSPIDLESITRWEDFSRAKDEMMVHTDTHSAPWHHVASDSKKQARLNMIHHLLSSLPVRQRA